MPSPAQQGDIPPVYQIDLSLPPEERYIHLATIYRREMVALTGLFDELLALVAPTAAVPWIKRVARIFLRRLHRSDETAELKGISRVTGIDMYLLVALNVLLDTLMGCTSGAALCQDGDDEGARPRMLHFRTLDWGMDALRKLLVRLEFVRSPDTHTVLATSITYVGFVGVLTGVRKGLSLSLNFRPVHDTSSRWANYRYYGSHLLVLLGLRPSIASVLRGCLIPGVQPEHEPPLHQTLPVLLRMPTTAAYLVLCDGTTAYVLEKDHRSAHVASDSTFIVATNSDQYTPVSQGTNPAGNHAGSFLISGEPVTMSDLVQDSAERRAYMQLQWHKKVLARRDDSATGGSSSRSSSRRSTTHRHDSLRRTRSSKAATSFPTPFVDLTVEPKVTATQREVIRWTTAYPITNEVTHFAAVMDPRAGRVVWIRRFLEAV